MPTASGDAGATLGTGEPPPGTERRGLETLAADAPPAGIDP